MTNKQYDIIVIGAGSAGLSVSLFMNKAGFNVLLVDKSDHNIGGDCLNDGCVPSKALIHVARLVQAARKAADFGLAVGGVINFRKVMEYVSGRQNIIRQHENAGYFRSEGLDVALGEARFTGRHEIQVQDRHYRGKKIVIATGSAPGKLTTPGIEQLKCYDNESIFRINDLPKNLLVVGGGPIGIELGQALSRLGSKVTIVHRGEHILPHDETAVTRVLHQQLEEEGIDIILNATVERFLSPTEAVVTSGDGGRQIVPVDAVFAGVGREPRFTGLQLEKAGVHINDGKIVVDDYLRTTNKDVYVCGDVAGSLQFSHAAELQARILLNNFFSPLKKKLNNDHMSWVTFTDPEVATFGLQETQLKKQSISYRRLETDFESDDRAVTDNHQYGKLVLYISQGTLLHKEKILGGSMVAPAAGELVQELILANTASLSIGMIFNKIYPYPVAARINQKAIIQYKEEALTGRIKKLLRLAFKVFG